MFWFDTVRTGFNRSLLWSGTARCAVGDLLLTPQSIWASRLYAGRLSLKTFEIGADGVTGKVILFDAIRFFEPIFVFNRFAAVFAWHVLPIEIYRKSSVDIPRVHRRMM